MTSPLPPFPARRRVVAGALGAGLLGLAGCAVPSARVEGVPSTTAPAPMRLQVFGDSITVGGVGWLRSLPAPDTSWLSHLTGSVQVAQVTAKSGATTELLSTLTPVSSHADLCLMALGTNDVTQGFTVAATMRRISDFLEQHAQALAPRVAIVTAGPRSNLDMAPKVIAWNAALTPAVAQQGWDLLDPWQALRTAESNGWLAPSYSKDGLHPTALGATLLGAGMSSELARVMA